jgi:hypothetical protein
MFFAELNIMFRDYLAGDGAEKIPSGPVRSDRFSLRRRSGVGKDWDCF